VNKKTAVNHPTASLKPMSSGADELLEPRQLRREKLWERCSSKRAPIINMHGVADVHNPTIWGWIFDNFCIPSVIFMATAINSGGC
jgi:hypothetical protein